MEKFLFWFISFDRSYGYFFDFGSYFEDRIGFEGQRDGEVLVFCIINICDLFVWYLVNVSFYFCCIFIYLVLDFSFFILIFYMFFIYLEVVGMDIFV